MANLNKTQTASTHVLNTTFVRLAHNKRRRKMKTKIMYVLVIIAMLLSACTAGSVNAKQTVATPASVTSKDSAAAAQEQNSQTGNSQGQSQNAEAKLPPKEAFDACTEKTEQQTCEFTAQKGLETGTCTMVQSQLACSPQRGPNDGKGNQTGNQQQGGGQQSGGQQNSNQQAGPQTDAKGSAYNIERQPGSRFVFPAWKSGRFLGFPVPARQRYQPDGTRWCFSDECCNEYAQHTVC
jgi:hypothetical protein